MIFSLFYSTIIIKVYIHRLRKSLMRGKEVFFWRLFVFFGGKCRIFFSEHSRSSFVFFLVHAARESTAAPPVPEKAERALLKNMQLLSEKKCCSLANFLWVQSRHQDCCIYKKNSTDKNSICIEAKCHLWKKEKASSSNYHFFFSYLGNFNLVPNSTQLHLPLVVEEFLPFFALFPPFAYLVWKSRAANARLFFSKMWCSLTHCNDFPVLYFFWKTLWPVLPQCVTVWRKNQQINDLYWLTIFRKNWKIAFWSALCSAGC